MYWALGEGRPSQGQQWSQTSGQPSDPVEIAGRGVGSSSAPSTMLFLCCVI